LKENVAAPVYKTEIIDRGTVHGNKDDFILSHLLPTEIINNRDTTTPQVTGVVEVYQQHVHYNAQRYKPSTVFITLPEISTASRTF
jgi:hypothetical protein